MYRYNNDINIIHISPCVQVMSAAFFGVCLGTINTARRLWCLPACHVWHKNMTCVLGRHPLPRRGGVGGGGRCVQVMSAVFLECVWVQLTLQGGNGVSLPDMFSTKTCQPAQTTHSAPVPGAVHCLNWVQVGFAAFPVCFGYN